MVDYNVSNGTCYFAQFSPSDPSFIPCGNVALGNWPCCQTGDICLGFESANACWDSDTGNTYVAGCTDSNYSDRTCMEKLGFTAQEWVAIQQCGNDQNGDKDWGGCVNHPANATALTKLPNSDCDPYCNTTLWVGSATIAAYATLPSSAGGSITWTNGFNPSTMSIVTASPPSSVTPSSASPTSGSDTPPSATSTPTPQNNDEDDDLTTGAKAGIGVGVAVAALLLVAAVFLCVCMRRRRRNRRQQEQPTAAEMMGESNIHEAPVWAHDHHHQQQQQPDGAFGTYSGFKSELPADNKSPGLSPDPSTHYAQSVSNASTLTSTYASGTPHHVSPQSTGNGVSPGYQNAEGGMAPIYELQGNEHAVLGPGHES